MGWKEELFPVVKLLSRETFPLKNFRFTLYAAKFASCAKTYMAKLSILVAEDDSDDRFLLQTAFTAKGYTDQLDFVENGVELMDHLHNIHNGKNTGSSFPYLILLDLNMPKKDGREALGELKRHPVLKKIPVVVFTTTKSEAEVKRCYELGANTYIVKPVSFEKLLEVLENIRSYWSATAAIPW